MLFYYSSLKTKNNRIESDLKMQREDAKKVILMQEQEIFRKDFKIKMQIVFKNRLQD